MNKAERLHKLHERLRTLLSELQLVQFEIWDLCQDMKSDSLFDELQAARQSAIATEPPAENLRKALQSMENLRKALGNGEMAKAKSNPLK
jgi:FtsZ-binding cell division protein ZapB